MLPQVSGGERDGVALIEERRRQGLQVRDGGARGGGEVLVQVVEDPPRGQLVDQLRPLAVALDQRREKAAEATARGRGGQLREVPGRQAAPPQRVAQARAGTGDEDLSRDHVAVEQHVGGRVATKQVGGQTPTAVLQVRLRQLQP